jgi:prepilin-type N-terminal cleavage/methylation domain-containing protein
MTKNKLQIADMNKKGLSLLEVLVVITIFAVLGILVTQSVILTLQGSKKSESIIRVRENLDYSLNIIERQIRNASFVYEDSTYLTQCSGTASTAIYYKDQNGKNSSFSCVNIGAGNSYIASGSARLTSDTIKVTSCSFVCTQGTMTNPALLKVDLTMQEASASGIQSANVSASTQIYLRND